MKSLVIFSVLAALILPAALLQAAPAPVVPGVGVIDLTMVEKNYKASREAMSYLSGFQGERRTIFEELKKGQYLTLELYTEYQTLTGRAVKMDPKRIQELQDASKKAEGEYEALMKKVKDGLTPEEQKRLTELEDAPQVTQETVKEYQDLMDKGKGAMSEADRTRLTQLDDTLKEVIGEINKNGERLGGEIQGERSRISQLLQDKVNEAIGVVAKKQKLLVVLNRALETQEGATQMVLWGGTDITESVTKELNDGFSADMFKPKK